MGRGADLPAHETKMIFNVARYKTMRAMVLNKPRTPLEWTELPERRPGPGEIRVKVLACGVCRTDLHVLDGELPDPKSPIIPGHEIVGRIDEIGLGHRRSSCMFAARSITA